MFFFDRGVVSIICNLGLRALSLGEEYPVEPLNANEAGSPVSLIFSAIRGPTGEEVEGLETNLV